jgi:hypothetical protein
LDNKDWARDISTQATLAGLTRVADYWQDNSPEDTWRCWHLNREHINLDAHVDLGPWQEELAKRKIPKLVGEDILDGDIGHGEPTTYRKPIRSKLN